MFDLILDGIKKAAKLIGGDTLTKATDVVNAIKGQAATNPEIEKALMQQEVEIKKLVLDDAKNSQALILEQSKSDDPFVRRARPAFLWLFYCIIGTLFVVLPILNTILTAFGCATITFTFPELPGALYQLFGASFLGYGAFRSFDKRTESKNGK